MAPSDLRWSRVGFSLLAAGAALASQVVHAQQEGGAPAAPQQTNELSVVAGAIWADNVLRVPAQPTEDTVGMAGLVWLYERTGPRLEVDIDLDSSYEHYLDETYDDRIVGGANADLLFAVVPDTFQWYFQDNFGQVRLLPTAATTPDNTENTNFFTTGPRLTARFGDVTTATLTGQYSNIDYETTAIDNDRYGGTLELARRFSDAIALAVGFQAETYTYDDLLSTEYEREEAYISYRLNTARTQLSLDVSRSGFEGDVGTPDKILPRFSLRRRLANASALSLSAGSRFSTSSDVFRFVQDEMGVRPDAELILPTADILEERYATLRWDLSRPRNSFGLSGEFRSEAYENQFNFDRDLYRFEAFASRLLSRTLTLGLSLGLSKEEFVRVPIDADEAYGVFSLEWRALSTLSMRLQYDRIERTSSLAATEYELNRFGLFLDWSPRASSRQ